MNQFAQSNPQSVLNFWFDEIGPKGWFRKSDAIDQTCRLNFEDLHARIVAGELAHWRDHPEGRLAEILVLDQFSRNMFRNTPGAFASDSLALALAQEAVREGSDRRLDLSRRTFLYMPYMHSESPIIHEHAVELFSATDNLDHELRHKAIIERFGRYPHRNAILGRESTPEELEWMKSHAGF